MAESRIAPALSDTSGQPPISVRPQEAKLEDTAMISYRRSDAGLGEWTRLPFDPDAIASEVPKQIPVGICPPVHSAINGTVG